ncbi:HNH endonuclease [Endozoicomonas gorgoniicola]|uniref:HNH endonuclease n=1 Tax=Endozoicomonas gorgoniicola TaxID=1234144 RepID=A0ABT3MQQ5_9GAMM|nr:HNH endonuclease [Endozoicomonas gorgoniicola]MCW7551705.1 HNH endonuclease [Endozoicomonas gorgoniicola]
MYILRLNTAGQPVQWLTWQQTVCLYSRELVVWSLGDIIYRIRGGRNRWHDNPTVIEVPSIVACGGRRLFPFRNNPALTNVSLFERDNYQCLYCGKYFRRTLLTRDHIVPTSRGGKDDWMNVVAACKRCNQYKSNYLLEELDMSLLALPYRPNAAEYLAMVNSRRILPEQAEYLSSQFSANCRWSIRSRLNAHSQKDSSLEMLVSE